MPHIRRMTQADVPQGLRLCAQAGWNQTELDWHRYLALQPDGCFVAECDSVVGTALTCIFGEVAWIAMVLVDESLRGRGIGRALMEHTLAFLDGRRVPTVRLDATPLGQPLYERLGFIAQYQLARYDGVLPAAAEVAGVETAADWTALAVLDEEVTRTDRRRLLSLLAQEQPAEVRVVRRPEGVDGFMMARHGARAIQLGPCIAAVTAGPRLLGDGWQRHVGKRVYVDVPLPNEPACRAVEAMGLTVQRRLTRMCRGPAVCERIDWLWASSGPEMG
jgi:GNAT superfamily N-acetyltransferase